MKHISHHLKPLMRETETKFKANQQGGELLLGKEKPASNSAPTPKRVNQSREVNSAR